MKVEEIELFFDQAYNQWVKQFEQKHSGFDKNIDFSSMK